MVIGGSNRGAVEVLEVYHTDGLIWRAPSLSRNDLVAASAAVVFSYS